MRQGTIVANYILIGFETSEHFTDGRPNNKNNNNKQKKNKMTWDHVSASKIDSSSAKLKYSFCAINVTREGH